MDKVIRFGVKLVGAFVLGTGAMVGCRLLGIPDAVGEVCGTVVTLGVLWS